MAHSDSQPPISLYLKIWLLLFVFSAFSYAVDYSGIQGFWRWTLVLTFMVLKAGLIVAVFMHVMWERLALIYTILVPPLAVLVLVILMAFEGSYIHGLRLGYFTAGAG